MTCQEYRERYQLFLDGQHSEELSAELRLHAQGCHECASYSAAMMKINQSFQHLSEVGVPADLLPSLRRIAQSDRSDEVPLSWSTDIRQGLTYLIPALIGWLIGMQTPIGVQVWINVGITFGVSCLLAWRVLRPIILGPSVQKFS